MSKPTRRELITSLGSASLFAWTWQLGQHRVEAAPQNTPLEIAPFRFDVTPPLGHSCCGGWIRPVERIDDELEAIGYVILGLGKPIIVCAVDWTGLLNSAHFRWRETLAKAADTTPDRVAVQCVHQHNAPFACLDAQQIVAQHPELPSIVDVEFFESCLERGAHSVRASLGSARPLTHIGMNRAKVAQVASNRRVDRDSQGRVASMRGSSCRDERLRGLPEGLIDPWLRTVAFYSGSEKVVAAHYYATHPMSFYADGRVTSDFAGLARKQVQQSQPDCTHLYFTGCAGNIAAGKYNDGSPLAREQLTDQVESAIRSSDEGLRPTKVETVKWQTQALVPQPRGQFDASELQRQIDDAKRSIVDRNRPAYTLAWLNRVAQRSPLVLSSLSIGALSILHLPAECFVQYQLHAQQTAGQRFVATAAYGDGGPWYIPTKSEYPAGGYEVSVAFCDPSIESELKTAIARLLDVD